MLLLHFSNTQMKSIHRLMEGFDWRCPLNVCTLIHMPMPRNSKHFSRQNYTFEVLFWPQKQWKYEEWVAKNTRYRNRSAKCLEIGFFALWPRIALLLATWQSDLTLSFLQIALGLHADWAMENIQWKCLCKIEEQRKDFDFKRVMVKLIWGR